MKLPSQLQTPWIIVVSYRNGTVQYYGPFTTAIRANEYEESIREANKPLGNIARTFVQAMIAPHNA